MEGQDQDGILLLLSAKCLGFTLSWSEKPFSQNLPLNVLFIRCLVSKTQAASLLQHSVKYGLLLQWNIQQPHGRSNCCKANSFQSRSCSDPRGAALCHMHKQKCHMHSDAAASVCTDEPSRWHENPSEARCPGAACCWHCKAAKHMAPWLCALRMQMESCQQNRRNSPHADNIAERQAARGGIRSRGAFHGQDRKGSML